MEYDATAISVPKGRVVETDATSLSLPKGKIAERTDHTGPQGTPSKLEQDLKSYKRKLDGQVKQVEELNRSVSNIKQDVSQIQDENADQLQGHGQVYGADDRSEVNWSCHVVCVEGSTAFVNAGYWRINGVDEAFTTCTDGTKVDGTGPTGGPGGTDSYRIQQYTLPLGGDVTYVCVSTPIVGALAPNICRKDKTRPPPNDGINYYEILCKCVLIGPGQYIITERNRKGDIIQSAPLRAAP